MIQESEIIRLILGIVVAFVFAMSPSGIERLPGRKWFVAAFYVLLSSWTFTVFEHLFLYDVLNILEHIGYLISGILYAYWCLKTTRGTAR
jgi:hypothetical protein